MRVLLVSTYELGHQPLHVASPAAALRAAGHDVRALDLAVERWQPETLDWAEAVAFSVPMHTASRLAGPALAAVRAERPSIPVAVYGLYAAIAEEASAMADRVIGGEYEPELVAWVGSLATGAAPATGTSVDLGRHAVRFQRPARDVLPPLERYARLAVGGEERTAGYVEASHGCAHRCRHCPVPVVYGGRTRIVAADTVLADVERLVEAGARHLTFGDPDFLNAAQHSLRIVDELHRRWPELTFDLTAKVEHVLRYRHVWSQLADAGCLFVVSAFESVDDEALRRLDKGHTVADEAEAIGVLRSAGIEPRPTWLPFAPWTEVADVADLVHFVADHDLIGNVDAVQYTIRLLLPPGSLLLSDPTVQARLGDYDRDRLTWTWTSADPAVDALQRQLAVLVEDGLTAGRSAVELFAQVHDAVAAALPGSAGAGSRPSRTSFAAQLVDGSIEGRPRLTEPWFC